MSEHDQIQYSIEIPDDRILDWIIGSVTHVDANDTPQRPSPAAKIPRVPSMLREKHNYEKYFAPQAVSVAAVQLPPITLLSRTKPVLLNLIAYETCLGKEAWFASYVCLLRSLIGNHEDVRVLKKAGVLQHRFGTDNDVVAFFNEIAADLIPQNEEYLELMDNIQSFYEGWSNTPISELRREYRKSPWKFISLLGASIALFLTAVQTYFAVWSRK
ncbi:hypothetical protein HanIR_Chr01g0044721 [Helianthus annuus]|nr:hypothetical protein HanIR_Chr01g0044721 [Helianthus annuus]